MYTPPKQGKVCTLQKQPLCQGWKLPISNTLEGKGVATAKECTPSNTLTVENM